MSELKACPFCGDSELVNSSLYEGHVFCTNCGVDMHVDIWQSRPIEDGLRAELASRDEIIARLKEDGERLADNYIAAKRMICACFVADYQVTLHRALMKELE